MRQAPILRFLSIFSSLFGLIMQIITLKLKDQTVMKSPYQPSNKYLGIVLSSCIAVFACGDKAERDALVQPSKDTSVLLEDIKKVDQASKPESDQLAQKSDEQLKLSQLNHQPKTGATQLTAKDKDLSDSSSNAQDSGKDSRIKLDTKNELKQTKKPNKKKKKKNSKCRRGIHKGRKHCEIQKGHISLYHINRNKRHKSLKIIDEQRRVIPEAREIMLEFLSDWRSKKKCKKGFSFNYEYKGRASWRMYDCYVQDRLLWYLYLIGHHFDSEIQIVSGLRAKERKTSRHHNGHAVDFRVRGVKAKEVWEYAKKTFPLVGAGYYPTTQFVHLDVGRDHHQAYWIDKSGSGESASYRAGVSQVQRGRAKKSQAGMISSIKRSLKRHYKSFKSKQKAYLDRKKRREARAKKRRKRRKKSRKKRKKKK